jgi:hypothetical protein
MEADTQLMEQLEADYASAEGSAAGATVRIGTANDTAEMATAIIAGTATDAVVLSAVAEQVAVKRLHTTVLDYNLVDLDSKAPHVHMPSELNDRQVNVERRTSVVDALRAAIKRDPQRPDLCMKLLETYQGTAAANRRAFEEFALLQAREPGSLSVEDWRKIVALGHEIGLDLGFLVEKVEDDLAHCA